MANIYVRSAAAGAGTGADWANAYTTKKAAAEAAGTAAGDDFWIAEDHAETGAAAVTITWKGTLAAPSRVICVDHLGSVPPNTADVRTTASFTTTGNSALTMTGCCYFYGIAFNVGTVGVSGINLGGSSQTDFRFERCAINSLGTSSPTITVGSTANAIGTRVIWDNTTYSVGHAGGVIVFNHGARFEWKGTASAITGATLPTNLFGAANGQGCVCVLDGMDLSALSAKTAVAAQTKNGFFYFKDCLRPASFTWAATPTSASAEIHVVRSASGATAYTYEKHDARGDQTTDTTVTRGGALAINGTVVSTKIIATANAKPYAPFESGVIAVPNTATGTNVTITAFGTWSGVAVPNNNEVWAEIGYLGSGSSPLLTFNSGTLSNTLAAATAQQTDGSTWTGGTTPFKIVTTLSAPQPALPGEMYVRYKSATTNTVWMDPTPIVS